jgi:hypothetical protein
MREPAMVAAVTNLLNLLMQPPPTQQADVHPRTAEKIAIAERSPEIYAQL